MLYEEPRETELAFKVADRIISIQECDGGYDYSIMDKHYQEIDGGVYVREVENSSPALAAGIKAGDILVTVGGKLMDGIGTFSDVILERSTREIVQVTLLRKVEDDLREMTVEVSLIKKK